jgi:hypothetical protein
MVNAGRRLRAVLDWTAGGGYPHIGVEVEVSLDVVTAQTGLQSPSLPSLH